ERLLAEGRAPSVIGAPGDYRPLILAGGHIYLERLLREEQRFIESISARLGAGVHRVDEGALARALAEVRASSPLSNEQATVVERGVHGRFSIISGGPGTGKTSIVVAILRVLARLGLPPEAIALAAPTGKAAKRVAESVRRGLVALVDAPPIDRTLLEQTPP